MSFQSENTHISKTRSSDSLTDTWMRQQACPTTELTKDDVDESNTTANRRQQATADAVQAHDNNTEIMNL